MRILLLLSLLAPLSLWATDLSLRYLDEYIIPADLTLDGKKVGGLSSIDYANGRYLMICDDTDAPRYYQAEIAISNNRFQKVNIINTKFLLNTDLSPFKAGLADPEGLRYRADTNAIFWSSEGSVKHQLPPAIYMQTNSTVSSFKLPAMFDISADSGPRHNALFEGLTLAHNGKGIWVSMEGPLIQDGEEANIEHGSLLRVTYFEAISKQATEQFAYYLEPMVNRPEAEKSAFRTTGLVEILQVNATQFLTMERSYTAGIEDGGNNVSIFLIDIAGATDTLKLTSLNSAKVHPAKKTLLLNLDGIKQKLGSKRIDNLEGMTLGPILDSGNPSLLMVSDNNFNLYGQQLSQILLFELNGL